MVRMDMVRRKNGLDGWSVQGVSAKLESFISLEGFTHHNVIFKNTCEQLHY